MPVAPNRHEGDEESRDPDGEPMTRSGWTCSRVDTIKIKKRDLINYGYTRQGAQDVSLLQMIADTSRIPSTAGRGLKQGC